MNQPTAEVRINRFPMRYLNETEKTVSVYSYTFKSSPESGKEYSAVNQILWKIGRAVGARFGDKIVTKEPILERYLDGDNWTLREEGTRLLNPEISRERFTLEQLESKSLHNKLKFGGSRHKIERSGEGGFIWWKTEQQILAQSGWEVHDGVHIDLEIHHSGTIFVEIDSHYRFYTAWTLGQWLKNFPELPISWVRNTYNDDIWRYVRQSEENPEELIIPGLGSSIADYHRNLKSGNATEAEIINAHVSTLR